MSQLHLKELAPELTSGHMRYCPPHARLTCPFTEDRRTMKLEDPDAASGAICGC